MLFLPVSSALCAQNLAGQSLAAPCRQCLFSFTRIFASFSDYQSYLRTSIWVFFSPSPFLKLYPSEISQVRGCWWESLWFSDYVEISLFALVFIENQMSSLSIFLQHLEAVTPVSSGFCVTVEGWSSVWRRSAFRLWWPRGPLLVFGVLWS